MYFILLGCVILAASCGDVVETTVDQTNGADPTIISEIDPDAFHHITNIFSVPGFEALIDCFQSRTDSQVCDEQAHLALIGNDIELFSAALYYVLSTDHWELLEVASLAKTYQGLDDELRITLNVRIPDEYLGYNPFREVLITSINESQNYQLRITCLRRLVAHFRDSSTDLGELFSLISSDRFGEVISQLTPIDYESDPSIHKPIRDFIKSRSDSLQIDENFVSNLVSILPWVSDETLGVYRDFFINPKKEYERRLVIHSFEFPKNVALFSVAELLQGAEDVVDPRYKIEIAYALSTYPGFSKDERIAIISSFKEETGMPGWYKEGIERLVYDIGLQ